MPCDVFMLNVDTRTAGKIVLCLHQKYDGVVDKLIVLKVLVRLLHLL